MVAFKTQRLERSINPIRIYNFLAVSFIMLFRAYVANLMLAITII